jgi:hypothetical protein
MDRVLLYLEPFKWRDAQMEKTRKVKAVGVAIAQGAQRTSLQSISRIFQTFHISPSHYESECEEHFRVVSIGGIAALPGPC